MYLWTYLPTPTKCDLMVPLANAVPQAQQQNQTSNSNPMSLVDDAVTSRLQQGPQQQGNTDDDNTEQAFICNLTRGPPGDIKSLPVTSSFFIANFDGFHLESDNAVNITRAILPSHIPIDLA
jgi:hypothetical protein